MDWFSGEIHIVAIPSSECKKELLESLWDLEAETLVENTSTN